MPNQFPIFDPRSVRENRERFRRDAIPALEYANSVYCPAGRYPTRGWVLLRCTWHDLVERPQMVLAEISRHVARGMATLARPS
jgi:hypothetical protein